MFHDYVTNARGVRIDIGRAQFLMDKQILREAVQWVEDNWERLVNDLIPPNGQKLIPPDRNQAIWGIYCDRHYEKYGRYFTPDVRSDPL